MSYFRKTIAEMAGYTPGEQPPRGAKVIKLNTNENPYPPSPAAIESLKRLDAESLRRYPDPFSRDVCRAVSSNFGVPEEWVLAGNGSDELLSLIIRACSGPGRAVVYPMPTYVLYRTLAQIQDAECVEIPFPDDYALPLKKLIAANGAVTLIASPNSPSGTVASEAILDELARNVSGIVAIDEAYTDFADENALGLVKRHPNVVILRTLSKGYSLAGLRLGYAVAQPEVLKELLKVKDSYNVDAITCLIGAAALNDQDYKSANAERIKVSRGRLEAELVRLGFRVWPSQANFLLTRPPGGDAERLYLGLKEQGILVRYFKQPRLDDKLRISVGTDQQNGILIAALSGLIK